jgi:nucleoside 2-deoxyribosyltransferase
MPQSIYFAGPLFMPYERAYISECAALLRAKGHQVFVPHENKWEGPLTAKQVFTKDMGGVHGASVIVAILDGVQVDDGTACEIGLFWGLAQKDSGKRRIIGLSTDARRLRKRDAGAELDINLFVAGCIEEMGVIVHSIEEVIAELDQLEGQA